MIKDVTHEAIFKIMDFNGYCKGFRTFQARRSAYEGPGCSTDPREALNEPNLLVAKGDMYRCTVSDF